MLSATPLRVRRGSAGGSPGGKRSSGVGADDQREPSPLPEAVDVGEPCVLEPPHRSGRSLTASTPRRSPPPPPPDAMQCDRSARRHAMRQCDRAARPHGTRPVEPTPWGPRRPVRTYEPRTCARGPSQSIDRAASPAHPARCCPGALPTEPPTAAPTSSDQLNRAPGSDVRTSHVRTRPPVIDRAASPAHPARCCPGALPTEPPTGLPSRTSRVRTRPPVIDRAASPAHPARCCPGALPTEPPTTGDIPTLRMRTRPTNGPLSQ